MIGALLALIWMEVMAVPTVPVTVGDADKDGVEVIDGANVGLTRIVHARAVPAPLALLPVRDRTKSPLWAGVPVMSPVDVSMLRPVGRPLAPKLIAVSDGLDRFTL